MREINKEEFVSIVTDLIIQTHYFLPDDVLQSLRNAIIEEDNKVAKDVLLKILENTEIASITRLPLCQDTGIPQFFINIGRNVCFNFNIEHTIKEIVEEIYEQEKLRKSCVDDPLTRNQNIHCCTVYIEHKFEQEQKFEISLLIRGGGSENTTDTRLFLPTSNIQEIFEYIVKAVLKMLPYTCPPVVVGIGIGGSVEYSMFLAKKALLRSIGERHPNKFYSDLEINIRNYLNQSNIGPLGLGGKFSVFDVFIEEAPTHIATLPVSITLQCHSFRRRRIIV